ncbi:60S ribosomal protein L11 [Lemmus lemmus]
MAQDQGEKRNPCRNFTSISSISVLRRAERLTLADTVLEQLTEQTPILSKVRYTVRSLIFKKKKKEMICCSLHSPSSEQKEILEKGLKVHEYELRKNNYLDDGTILGYKNTLTWASNMT